MDISFYLDCLVPAAVYGGSLTDNTEDAYNSIVWGDLRPKPSFQEIIDYADSDAGKEKLAESKFSVDQFIKDLNSALADDPNMLQYYAAVKDWATYKNFEQISTFLNGMLSLGKITQAEFDAVETCLLNQGIHI